MIVWKGFKSRLTNTICNLHQVEALCCGKEIGKRNCGSKLISEVACVTGQVLQNRLQMAHDLKQLTDLAHNMTGTELDDLRLHVKVA